MEQDLVIALRYLEQGRIILHPTDTVWGLGCDAFCEPAVERIFTIKRRSREKSFILLVSSREMLERYVSADLDRLTDVIEDPLLPTTVVYPEVKGLPAHIKAEDGSVAIRIVQHADIGRLIERLDRPIVSTSANISGEPVPASLPDIDRAVRMAVDYILPISMDTSRHDRPSRIYQLSTTGSLSRMR